MARCGPGATTAGASSATARTTIWVPPPGQAAELAPSSTLSPRAMSTAWHYDGTVRAWGNNFSTSNSATAPPPIVPSRYRCKDSGRDSDPQRLTRATRPSVGGARPWSHYGSRSRPALWRVRPASCCSLVTTLGRRTPPPLISLLSDVIGMTQQAATAAIAAAPPYAEHVVMEFDNDHVGTVSATDPPSARCFESDNGGGVQSQMGTAAATKPVPTFLGTAQCGIYALSSAGFGGRATASSSVTSRTKTRSSARTRRAARRSTSSAPPPAGLVP